MEMATIFMNSGNSKVSSPHSLVLNLSNKIGLRRGDIHLASSNFSVFYM